jgi:methylenetetrahydrofolate reductase (NADPH)
MTSAPGSHPTESTLQKKLKKGAFALTIEMVPPRAPSISNIVKRLDKYFKGFADAVNITDCASAILRMSSLGASMVCLQQGFEPVLQMTCRDRNRIAIQSELISAYALGVRNILCLTGDQVGEGDHPAAKPVFDMDAINLIYMVNQMRKEGRYHSGEAIKLSHKSKTIKMDWLIGGAANPYGNPPNHLATRLEKKRLAGVNFLQTQPIYDPKGFDAWWRALDDRGLVGKVKILPGILPPKSAQGLEFVRDNIPGMQVPEASIRRMKSAEKAKKEGKKLTLEIVDFLLQYPIDGLHLYPVHWESYMPELATEIREKARKAGHKVHS